MYGSTLHCCPDKHKLFPLASTILYACNPWSSKLGRAQRYCPCHMCLLHRWWCPCDMNCDKSYYQKRQWGWMNACHLSLCIYKPLYPAKLRYVDPVIKATIHKEIILVIVNLPPCCVAIHSSLTQATSFSSEIFVSIQGVGLNLIPKAKYKYNSWPWTLMYLWWSDNHNCKPW